MPVVIRRGPRRRGLAAGLLIGGAVATKRHQQAKEKKEVEREIAQAKAKAALAEKEARRASRLLKEQQEKQRREITTVVAVVPASASPGASFQIIHNDKPYNVNCPEGVKPGQKIRVTLPADTMTVVAAQPEHEAIPVAEAVDDFKPLKCELTLDHVVNEKDPAIQKFGIISVRKPEGETVIVDVIEGDLTSGLGGTLSDYIKVASPDGQVGLISRYAAKPIIVAELEEDTTVPPAALAPPPALTQ